MSLRKLESANDFWATKDYVMCDVDGKLSIVNQRTLLVEAEPETEYNGLMLIQWMQETLEQIRKDPVGEFKKRIAHAQHERDMEAMALKALADIGVDDDVITKLN